MAPWALSRTDDRHVDTSELDKYDSFKPSEGSARLLHFDVKVKYLCVFRVNPLTVTCDVAAEDFPIASPWSFLFHGFSLLGLALTRTRPLERS